MCIDIFSNINIHHQVFVNMKPYLNAGGCNQVDIQTHNSKKNYMPTKEKLRNESNKLYMKRRIGKNVFFSTEFNHSK